VLTSLRACNSLQTRIDTCKAINHFGFIGLLKRQTSRESMPPSASSSDSDPLATLVEQTIETQNMLSVGERVLVGVSGGPDSMALLHLLRSLASRWKIQLGVAHLNHCLRGEAAEKDAEMVRKEAAALNYPCYIDRTDVIQIKHQCKLSLEEAGRRARSAFFEKMMRDKGYDKLAVGHHRGDNAEQVLLALLRGSGPRGLSGIAPVRGGRIIRPLIRARRSRIEAYVRAKDIPCSVDVSNDDPRFLRNRIRHHLLPLLAADYNPRIEDQLNRLADVMRTDEAWINGIVKKHLAEAMVDRSPTVITLAATRLNDCHPGLARRLIRAALEELVGSLRKISFTHIQAAMELLADQNGAKEIHLPGGIRIRKSSDRLRLMVSARQGRGRSSSASATKPATQMTIKEPLPETIKVEPLGIGLRFSFCSPHRLPRWSVTSPQRAYLDGDRLAFPLTIRSIQPGDRFAPLGAGGSQKLKKFFIDHGIPKKERSNIPVLTDSRRIIWLVGQRIDENVKVTARTTRILQIEFFLLDTR
jgi:tRNA(Ile)-lysidine synthase